MPCNFKGSRCGRADSVMDSHTTGPGFKIRLAQYKLSVRWCVWKVGEDFPNESHPRH